MSTLPEQFSAARKSQVEAQINFFQNYATSAVENVEKLVALNLRTTRASLQQSSYAVQQLLAAKDPRDLIALTTQSQERFEHMLAYGRQLFSIATSSQAAILKQATPVVAPPVAIEAPALAPLKAPMLAPASTAAPAAVPAAKAKPVAKAVGKAAPAKPAAARVPVDPAPVVVSGLAAVETAPPVVEQKVLEFPAPKGKKKK
jgi:phasin family protein